MSILRRIQNGEQPQQNPIVNEEQEPEALSSSPLQVRRNTSLSGASSQDTYQDLKTRVQKKLLAEIDPSVDVTKVNEVKKTIQDLFDQILVEENFVLSRTEKSRLFEQITAEILGLGPLQPLLEDDTITEVMVNGAKNIYVERRGKIQRAPLAFENNEHVMRIIERIVAPLGRRIDESSPYVDARLQDGSRVNAIIPPVSLVGPVLTIRKFARTPFTVDQLIQFGSLTPEAVQFLDAAVKARINVVISGGTGSGKTTLLNVMSGFIPADERIITIENAAELQLRQEHVVTLESRPANIEGKGEITIRHLVINALRMRPDRIIVGEIRDEAALDMLQAMNTGHDGSLTTIHANSPRDALLRLETLVAMAGMNIPNEAIRRYISSALQIVIQIARLIDGSRKLVSFSEITGMEGNTVTMQEIFSFEQTGVNAKGEVTGKFRMTGIMPRFVERFKAAGIDIPYEILDPRNIMEI